MNIQSIKTEPLVLSGRDVTAVLGPTNTGKTHLAIERMVAHESGVIGLPLRLLAREVYGRVAEKVGTANVALVTGEEKIQPPGARYSVCTVEAMPRQTDAAFVAIDEVQLANDLERGHTFTDRILHLRGRQETLLLGAATMRGILEKLLRGISVVTRPRMSHLAYAGQKKITRLPHRSAIVAFSADEVYAIGELIRRQRGGVAVVLGALSPRTRNKQVELYQSGDVDYLVATDAIGMGLNLDVDHVAFAQNRKFDGYQYRQLTASELGQIAGRAGRHLRDGTFGVTGQVDPFEDDLVQKIEAHDFEPVRVLQWRTANFDFSSLDALRRSIETPSPVEGLTRALPSVDVQALEFLARDESIRGLATDARRVALLWDACALPDYRKIAPAQHADLIASIYADLARRGHVDEDYMADQVRRADMTEGDIDVLSQRIAQIRTWTFVSHRPGWLADPAHWQEKTREIEDRLSDALHERLTKRFVDRRTSALMRRLRENAMLDAEISQAGAVLVEGHHVGELQGFRFTADQSAEGEDAKAVRTAAQKALAVEFDSRADRFAAAANAEFALGSDGLLRWVGSPVGVLAAGEDLLKPRVILLADEQLTGPSRDKVMARAERYVSFQIESHLKPLVELRDAQDLAGMARGIAFRLVEGLGSINRREIADDVKALDQEARAALRRLGVRFGAYHIFLPAMLKPAPASIVTLLWTLKNDAADRHGFGDVVHALASGRTSIVVDPAFEKEFYRLAGYRVLGRRAVRLDILERLADLIRPALSWKEGTGPRPDGAYDGNAFLVTPPMMSILGATADDMEEILKGLGYRGEPKPAASVQARLAEIDAAARKAAEEKATAKARAEAAAKAEAEAAAGQGEAAVATAAEPGDTISAGEQATDEQATEPAESAAVGGTAENGEAPSLAAVETGPDDAEVGANGDAAPASPEQTAVSEGEETADAVSSDEAAEPVAVNLAPAASGGETPAPALGVDLPTTVEGGIDTGTETPPEEEPKPILIWRPGRFDNRPRHPRRDGQQAGRGRRQGGPPGQGAPAQGQPAGQERPADQADAGNRQRHGRPRDGERRERRPDQRQGGDRPEGGRPFKGPRRDERKRDDQRGERSWQAKPPREDRKGGVDPDSPFAKLAALRDKLKT